MTGLCARYVLCFVFFPRKTKKKIQTIQDLLNSQIFTSHGPSLVAPTWCMSRKLYDSIGGFQEAQSVGYPEDLRFFYDAVKLGAEFVKVIVIFSLPVFCTLAFFK